MANKDLEIGDRVMLSPNHDYRITKTTPAEYNPVGIKGTVVPYTWGLQEGHWVQVEWDNGLTNHYPITDDYLININKLGNKMTNHTPEALISSISGDYFLGSDAELELAKNIVAQLSAVTAQRDELLAAIKKISAVGAKNSSFQEQMAEVENIAFSARRIVEPTLQDAKYEVKP